MIAEVDRSLRALLCAEVRAGDPFEVSFEPDEPAASGPPGVPVLTLHLHDVVEVVSRRPVDVERIRENGLVVAQSPGRRWYRLSYRVSAWAAGAEAEHELLSLVLRCLVVNETIPRELLSGSLAETRIPVTVSVAVPRSAEDARDGGRAPVGRPERLELDVVVTVPLEPEISEEIVPPPEERRVGIGSVGGAHEERSSMRRPSAAR